jgi:hypothetical protein
MMGAGDRGLAGVLTGHILCFAGSGHLAGSAEVRKNTVQRRPIKRRRHDVSFGAVHAGGRSAADGVESSERSQPCGKTRNGEELASRVLRSAG